MVYFDTSIVCAIHHFRQVDFELFRFFINILYKKDGIFVGCRPSLFSSETALLRLHASGIDILRLKAGRDRMQIAAGFRFQG